MKLIIQRVNKASVIKKETGEQFGKIDNGLFVLVGFGKDDTSKNISELVKRLVKLRIMSDENDKMNKSISEVGGSILVVSQFTLYADTNGGNRPSFINAMEPDKAIKLYEQFITELSDFGIHVETGSFGNYMEISTILDGPVTITLEN